MAKVTITIEDDQKRSGESFVRAESEPAFHLGKKIKKNSPAQMIGLEFLAKFYDKYGLAGSLEADGETV